MTNKRPSGVSQLDSLWLALGGYQTSNQSEGQSKENILVTEQKLTETINEVTGGCISTLQFNEETSQLIGTTSDGQQISIVNLPKEVHIVDFKVRNIVQEDIDKGCTYDLDTQVLSIKTSDNQEYILSVKELNVELLGSESDTISTRVVNGVVNSQLKINNGNNQLSAVELKTSSDGIYADIKIGETDGVKLEKSSSGLTAKIPMSNDFVKFELITWSDYSILENKAQNTVYFLSDKPYIYLNGVKYGADSDSIENLNNQIDSLSEQVSNNTDEINSLKQSVNSSNEQITQITQQVNINANQINTISEQIEGNTNKISTLTEQVNTCTEQVNTCTSQINTINESVNTCTTKVEEMTKQVNSNTNFINQASPMVINQLAYGVEWDINVADPHITRIGNMDYHRTLPIQSQLKGCIAQGGNIIYWLNETDWRFKKNPEIIYSNLTVDNGYSLSAYVFSTLQYEKQWVKINNVPCQIDSIDTNTQTATLIANDELNALNLSTGTQNVEFGSVLNGYDGTVRIYCPKFYIKSEIDENYRRVWISKSNIDGKFTEQPSILIDAYHSTVLNEVPENMGYLSRLPVNSAISVVNTHDYCRGGENQSSFDYQLTQNNDPYGTQLGKPRVGIPRITARTYARNANSELISYEQYKNILYWLYVIEYANFNYQEDYTEELTAEGFKQGGLGKGIDTVPLDEYLHEYNGDTPITPCGYAMQGNDTGIKPLIIDKEIKTTQVHWEFNVPRWRGFENHAGEIYTILDGLLIYQYGHTYMINYDAYISTNPNNYMDDSSDRKLMDFKVESDPIFNNGGYIREFNLKEAAHIIPNDNTYDQNTFKCGYVKSNLMQAGTTGAYISIGKNQLCNMLAHPKKDQLDDSTQTLVGFRTVSNFISPQ